MCFNSCEQSHQSSETSRKQAAKLGEQIHFIENEDFDAERSFETFCVRSQIDNYINVAVTDFKREYLVPQLTFSILFYSFCLTNFLEKYQLGQPSGMPD